MADYEHFCHEFAPIYDEHSEILILGTFPSVKSREQQFYYGHPQNRFWKVLSALTGFPLPVTVEEKKRLLLQNHIAIWDVIQSCEIVGSSDNSIKNVIPADIPSLLSGCKIRCIYGNGAKACELYDTYILPQTGIPIVKLPSTSPANASFSLEKLIQNWGGCIIPFGFFLFML